MYLKVNDIDTDQEQLALHYENTPIQIYWKFYHKKKEKKIR